MRVPKVFLWALLCLACSAPPLAVKPEPPGVNCTQGGVSVSNGDNEVFICNGEQGSKGDKGDTGPQGNQGPQGQPGQSVALPSVIEGSFSAFNQIDIDALQNVTTITGNLTLNVSGLSSVSLPNLTTIKALGISGTDLTDINFPALTSVPEAVFIFNNPLLPTCQAQALVAQLNPAPTTVTISGNNDIAVCP